jgi:hypothetical protein
VAPFELGDAVVRGLGGEGVSGWGVGVGEESLLGVEEVLGGVPGRAVLDQHVLPVDPPPATAVDCLDRVNLGC